MIVYLQLDLLQKGFTDLKIVPRFRDGDCISRFTTHKAKDISQFFLIDECLIIQKINKTWIGYDVHSDQLTLAEIKQLHSKAFFVFQQNANDEWVLIDKRDNDKELAVLRHFTYVASEKDKFITVRRHISNTDVYNLTKGGADLHLTETVFSYYPELINSINSYVKN